MKLTVLLLITGIMQVSASALAQKVTLSEKRAPLSQVFDDISNQTGLDFVFTSVTLNGSKPVTINVKNAELEDVLKKIFDGQPLAYFFENKAIIVSPSAKPDSKFMKQIDYGELKGTITDSLQKPISNVTVKLKGLPEDIFSTITNQKGEYLITKVPSGKYLLTISHLGYKSVDYFVRVEAYKTVTYNITLQLSNTKLDEVVVSTGYQTLPKERATGSFEVVNTKQLNFTVSSNIMDHLDGIVSGVNFDHRTASYNQSLPAPPPTFTVRGLSTINANAQPLIVVDNFPYKGDINNINPNDVESVTILKDAAAASIWGSQAGNGVVVITTKKGKYNQAPTVDFNSSISVGTKPDLFSQRQISTSDYIGLEESLFKQGIYNFALTDPQGSQHAAITPVVALLAQAKNGTISQANADAQIEALGNHDVRNDLLKYFYKSEVNQQYNLDVKGGSEKSKYYISLGYNKDRAPNTSEQNRYTINATNTYTPIKNLEISTPIYFTQNNSRVNNNFLSNQSYYPYAQLADANGNPLDVNLKRTIGYSDMAISKGLYSEHYNPLEEFRLNQYGNYANTEVRINPSISYKFLNGFSAELQYQYDYSQGKFTQDQSDSTYDVRDKINSYTQIGADGTLSYPINRGHFLTLQHTTTTAQDLRAQLNYNHDIGKDHRIDAIAGFEHSETRFKSDNNFYYGYNPNTGQFQAAVDYVTQFQMYGSPFKQTILPPNLLLGDTFNVLDSKFADVAYTYKNRYIISGSGRIDQTNLFGANSNNQQKILWSAGASWLIDHEGFYHVDWLPSLKLRATYGFQGNEPANLNNGANFGSPTSVSPLATIQYSFFDDEAGLPFAYLNSISNPNLTWEKIGQLNFGIDFAAKNNIVSGSLEYYHKNGSGLIASYPVDPTLGVTSNVGNTANIAGNGIDVTINTKNINGKFQWGTTFIFNHNTDKVTKYLIPEDSESILQITAYSTPSISPIKGNAIYGVYSLKSAGLDPVTGAPRGYLNGAISEDYEKIMENTPLKDLVYSGSAQPTYFGSMMNNFSYAGFSLRVNITYKTGFYFHARSVNYNNLYGGSELGSVIYGADYAKRWQKPGDEKTTYVPSAPTLAERNFERDAFYQATSNLVQKGDNVRLQKAEMAYDFRSDFVKRLHMSYIQLYTAANLNTIIWRANKMGIDPEYVYLTPSKVYSLGLRASF